MGHHYVPRHYLKGFAAEGLIWAHDRGTQSSFPSNVKSIANENKMYSEDVETFLANSVEAPAQPVFDKLRLCEAISEEERRALARYITILWKRTPKGRERAMEMIPEVADAVHTEICQELDAASLIQPEIQHSAALLKARVAKAISDQKANPSTELWYRSFETNQNPNLVDALLSMNWVFLRTASSQFLTSDNPVFFFEFEGIGRASSELTFPLSNSLTLWATRSAIKSGVFLQASTQAIKEVNRRTAYNSSRFVYSSRNEKWILPFVSKGNWRLTRLGL